MPSLQIKIPEERLSGFTKLLALDDAVFQELLTGLGNSPLVNNKESVDLERKFQRLAREWREETAHVSSMTDLVLHPKYQSIIGMGAAILPILFRELQSNPDYWFWALNAITEEDPTNPEDTGDLLKLTESWLKWAKENGYL